MLIKLTPLGPVRSRAPRTAPPATPGSRAPASPTPRFRLRSLRLSLRLSLRFSALWRFPASCAVTRGRASALQAGPTRDAPRYSPGSDSPNRPAPVCPPVPRRNKGQVRRPLSGLRAPAHRSRGPKRGWPPWTPSRALAAPASSPGRRGSCSTPGSRAPPSPPLRGPPRRPRRSAKRRRRPPSLPPRAQLRAQPKGPTRGRPPPTRCAPSKGGASTTPRAPRHSAAPNPPSHAPHGRATGGGSRRRPVWPEPAWPELA
mmetsp:Transcript_31815/g.71608  ORF Transcript_31815/g.71608 Transcript_31815/m.71608 type:complete len:258 (+) Transcript_31815:333-1106(+)